MSKAIHCDWCGGYLGEGDKYPGEPESCGKPECNREVRDMYQAARAERMWEAEEDDYMRY